MWPRQLTRWDGTAEVAAVRKEAETKLVAITWLPVGPPGRPPDRARGRGGCCALWNGVVPLPCRGRAYESERRLGRPNAVRTMRRARARSQATGGWGRGGKAVGWVRMSMGGRGNGGWERGAPLRGEITLVAENGGATLRWGRRKRRRERGRVKCYKISI